MYFTRCGMFGAIRFSRSFSLPHSHSPFLMEFWWPVCQMLILFHRFMSYYSYCERFCISFWLDNFYWSFFMFIESPVIYVLLLNQWVSVWLQIPYFFTSKNSFSSFLCLYFFMLIYIFSFILSIFFYIAKANSNTLQSLSDSPVCSYHGVAVLIYGLFSWKWVTFSSALLKLSNFHFILIVWILILYIVI